MMKTPSRKQVIHNNSSYPKDENFIVPDLAEELCSPGLSYYYFDILFKIIHI